MSTRTDWGIFDKDGKPLAVGDEWHKWKCPQQRYAPTGYEHTITGEWVNTGFDAVPCPFKSAGVKVDRCTKCGAEFRYP